MKRNKQLSRQRLWQLARKAKGLCIICGKPAQALRCKVHAAAHAARMRAARASAL